MRRTKKEILLWLRRRSGDGKVFIRSSRDIVMVKIKGDVAKLKKGDKVKVDGRVLEVDAHAVLIDHGKNKEMAVDLFDGKSDEDFQLRYFDDRVEESLEFYVLEEIIYNRKEIAKVEF
jgi:F0F1-type ATP synthase alpha subunit